MSHEDIDYVTVIRKHGYRVTPQRLVVLDAVCDLGRHAAFSDILKRARELESGINPATVYRALDMLCEVGLVVSAEIEKEGRVYEIAGDKPHHHLVCRQCGRQYTLTGDHLETFAAEVRNHFGFRIETEHLVIGGICENCQKAAFLLHTQRKFV